MKFRFPTGMIERLTLAFEAYLDEKYPEHAHHEVVSWAELIDEEMVHHRGFGCSCGGTMVLTFAEMIGIDAVPLQ